MEKFMKSLVDFFVKRNFLYLLLFFFVYSLSAITIALYSQYIEGLTPCALCILERISYYIIMLTSFISMFFFTIDRVYFLYIILATFFINAGISFYHILLEQKIISSSGECQGIGVNFSAGIDQLRNALLGTAGADCSSRTAIFFNLSFTDINFITSIFFIAILIVFLLYVERNYNVVETTSR